jgi:TRAP-type transport system periplasmic protein
LALSFFLGIIVGGSCAWADDELKPMTLRVTASWPPPETCMISEIFQMYLDEVTKRTNGKMKFQVFWGCALGAPPEQYALVKSGAVEMGHVFPWFTPGEFPLANFEYTLPFGPVDYELLIKARRQMRAEFPQFEQEELKQNLVMLCQIQDGKYDFLSKIPLKTIEDFKGQKVTLIGRYFGRWLPPGASAVVRPGHERYDMLRSGVIDIDLLPFPLFYAFKIHEQTKYYLDAGFTASFWTMAVMNKDFYNKLPPQTQKLLVDVGKEVELRAVREIIPKWWKKCVTEWKERGIEFYTLPESEKKKWIASIKYDPEEWGNEMAAKGLPGHEIVQRWQEVTTDMGFKWDRHWGKMQ